jgi:hypothetical protein
MLPGQSNALGDPEGYRHGKALTTPDWKMGIEDNHTSAVFVADSTESDYTNYRRDV